jgi:D-methionine transport system ATP-binding protein
VGDRRLLVEQLPIWASKREGFVMSATAMVQLEDVEVSFGPARSSVQALRGVSLTVPKGEVFGVVGTSGAGKSTLLRTINLLQRPSHGEVWIGQRQVTNLQGSELRQLRLRVGMVFQHFELVSARSVFDNVALPLRAAGRQEKEIQARVQDLLQLVELSDKAKSRPGQLSGGQKQRVGIARALANEPELLLCDEPTSALDLETTESILALLAGINHRLGVTIVLISHEMDVIKRICHRVAVMKDGRIVEENETYRLFATPEHPLSRELVSRALDLAVPRRVTEQCRGVLVRLLYLGPGAEEPALAETARRIGVTLNILHGRIEYIQERPIGILIVTIQGATSEIELALDELRSRVARLEVLHG